MCLGVPGRIVELDGTTAVVDVLGARRSAETMLVDGDVAVGDWVLLHVGFAIARIDEDEARATEELFGEALAAEVLGAEPDHRPGS